MSSEKMRIAVVGCAHGELEIIYETIEKIRNNRKININLLICCGDFQATRNLTDLECMAVPDKYKDICTFYKYYSGEKKAPILTIFIGGNHEASNYLQELPYGGWVAPNIYYLGYAGVIHVAGMRIAGLSGIYKAQHYIQGHYEKPPYSSTTIRSVYHIRNLEVYRLKQLSDKIDIFLSHDWPAGITKYGNEDTLLKEKPFFKNDIENNTLGSEPCMDLLQLHYPAYWFSAHMHCKFAAIIPENKQDGARVTKFLALDKCLPKRKFLQVLPEIDFQGQIELSYDLEWLTILYLTNHLLSVKGYNHYMPGQYSSDRLKYTPTQEEKQTVYERFNSDLRIPLNFTQTVKPYDPCDVNTQVEHPQLLINKQTTQFCQKLGIDDPFVLLQIMAGSTKDNKLNEPVESDYKFESMETSFNEETSMKLFPKNNDDEYQDLSCTEIKSTLENSAINPTTDSSWIEDTKGEYSEPSTEPNYKKFKRRNYSIYSNTL